MIPLNSNNSCKNGKKSITFDSMDRNRIDEIVLDTLKNYCEAHGITEELTMDTHLIGRTRIVDSIGLVNTIVDIETAFLDEDVEISLTSETAMSLRLSPFRTIGTLCDYIARQLGVEENHE